MYFMMKEEKYIKAEKNHHKRKLSMFSFTSNSD